MTHFTTFIPLPPKKYSSPFGSSWRPHRSKCIKCQEGEVGSGKRGKKSWLTCISAVYAHSLILTSEYLFGPTGENHPQQLETPWTVAREPNSSPVELFLFFPLQVLFLEVCGWDTDTTVQWINAPSIVSLSQKKIRKHCWVFLVQHWNRRCARIAPPIQTEKPDFLPGKWRRSLSHLRAGAFQRLLRCWDRADKLSTDVSRVTRGAWGLRCPFHLPEAVGPSVPRPRWTPRKF